MTTFRTCSKDMLDFIWWMIRKKRIHQNWNDIRGILEFPENFYADYYDYQKATKKLEG